MYFFVTSAGLDLRAIAILLNNDVSHIFPFKIHIKIFVTVDLDSSVGIATPLRTERSGDRIPVDTIFSAHVQTGPRAHSTSYTMCTVSF